MVDTQYFFTGVPMIAKRMWHFFAVVSLFLLTACLPEVTFTINPEPAFVGEPVTFDASATYADAQAAGIRIKSAKWNFGDKANNKNDDDDDGDEDEGKGAKNSSKAKGKIVQHTFTAPGTYTITLKIKDSKGRKLVTTDTLVVNSRTAAGAGALIVNVRDAGGATIPGASVAVGSANAVANALGVATLANLPSGANQVVRISKSGYISQSLISSVTAGNTSSLPARLMSVGQTLVVGHIDAQQTLVANKLGASISFPQDAFANPNGTIATGLVLVDITPWDVTNSDLNAMLGNGRAKDAAGNLTDLISAGMISAEFRKEDGTKLNLAPGKKATIRMDLPYASLNNQPLELGSTIPMWTFSETQGLWLEEGVGTVTNSTTYNTQYALEAMVSHFSTWNWDFKLESGGSVNVKCISSTGAAVPCDIVADVTLPEGGRFTKSSSVPVDGLTIINMPTTATIVWTANAGNGVIGTKTSGASGNVNILLAPATTSNNVKCQLVDGTPVACSLLAEFTLQDASITTLPFSAVAGGSQIETVLPATGIQWRAQSTLISLGNGVFKQYSGSALSGVADSFTITLDTEVVVNANKYIEVSCDFATNSVPATSCDVKIDYLDIDDLDVTIFQGTLLAGEVRRIGLPPQILDVYEGDSFDIRATAIGTNGLDFSTPYLSQSLSGLFDGQAFRLLLRSSNSCPPIC